MTTAEAGPAASEDPAWRALPLDNLTLTRKEGFAAFAEARETPAPPILTMADLKALDPQALEHYNDERRRFLANLRPIKTMQARELSANLADIFDAGVHQPSWQAKGMAAIDAFPGLGKTTVGLSFAKKVHNTLIGQYGRFTEAGHERWPVIRVGMMGDTRVKDFNWAMLESRLRETEAERDQLREALKETEEKLKSTLKESRSSSSHRAGK